MRSGGLKLFHCEGCKMLDSSRYALRIVLAMHGESFSLCMGNRSNSLLSKHHSRWALIFLLSGHIWQGFSHA